MPTSIITPEKQEVMPNTAYQYDKNRQAKLKSNAANALTAVPPYVEGANNS